MVGLFDEPTRIGYERQWSRLVAERGYRVVGHELVPLGNEEGSETDGKLCGAPLHDGWQAARELTAMVRYGFSAPVQSLARYGFLDGRYTVFDYGCGRGDDLRGLRENGLAASGWDPYYAPDESVHSADIVNLGFVVNVIEDFDERLEALTRAWSLAQQLLVVSVMLDNQNETRGTRFRDGVLTQRGTFQKYYTQAEIRAYLESALDEESIPVGPGIHYVFRDKDLEQRFLMERYRSRRNILRLPSVVSREGVPARVARRNQAEERYQTYRDPLDRLWALALKLGRAPDKSEVEDLIQLIEGFGSLPRAFRFMQARNGPEALEHAKVARTTDLEVYFALNLFERRKPYRQLEMGLQRDIKTFFGDYGTAVDIARERLFAIATPEVINRTCQEAAEHGLGWLEQSESLQLHTSMVDQLPALLRIYVGCAAVLYGDYRNADLIKIHIRSGKVSLMRYDDFEGNPLPRMVERVKIKLREQDIDYFRLW
jgi:DNA phosphorothioation-associated putative methyltransferase